MAIKFTNQALYLKGTATAYLQDSDNNIVYASDKFQTSNITTSVTAGEIRGGIGNPILMMIPTDSSLTVNFVAADFSLFAKAAQLGATLSYGAPVMVCQTVEATGETLTLDVSGGTPVAAPGSADVVAYVQQIGAASPVEQGGTAYPVDASGVVSGFNAVAGTSYKVWYHVNRANAQIATVNSLFDPAVYRFTAVMALYSSPESGSNQGTHVGNLTIIVPRLKLGGDAGGVNGDQTGNDTTSITGQALAFDETVVGAGCDDCGGLGNPFAYYIYAPCDPTEGLNGLALVGGVIDVAAGTVHDINEFRLVGRDNSLIVPDPAFMRYTVTPDTLGTVSGSTFTAGTTAGDGEIVATYTDGDTTFTCPANLSVTTA